MIVVDYLRRVGPLALVGRHEFLHRSLLLLLIPLLLIDTSALLRREATHLGGRGGLLGNR